MSGEHTHPDIQAQIDALHATMDTDVAELQAQVDLLEARVTALEGETPIEPPEPEPEPPGEMSATITIGGASYVYDVMNGTNLGDCPDIVGPLIGQGVRFRMSCVRVTRPDCPIRVDFRGIDGTPWWCAVFDYGDVFGHTGTQANLPAMTVVIGGQTIELASHPWGSRWRWQSCPWPFPLIDAATLIAHKLLLDFDPTIGTDGGSPEPSGVVCPPFGWEAVGLTAYFPQTGSRDDIGYVTGAQGRWLCGKGPADSVLAQGEAGGTPPWRMYDAAKGRTVDCMFDWPSIAMDGGNPPIVLGVGGEGSTGITIDAAHQPAVSYVPLLMTGDPYFLENLHSQCTFGFVECGKGSIYVYGPGIIQVRAYAWNLRSIMAARAVTPEDAPSWQLPKASIDAMWQWCVNGMRQMIDAPPYTHNAAFHDVSPNTWSSKATWQMDFVAHVSAAAAKLHPDWVPIAEWHAYNLISRIDGKSGWGRNLPDPYQFFIGDPKEGYAETFYGSWDEAWTGNMGATPKGDLDMAKPPDGQGDYINGMRSALAALSQAPLSPAVLAEVRACLDYLTPYHQSWCRNGFPCESKWAARRA